MHSPSPCSSLPWNTPRLAALLVLAVVTFALVAVLSPAPCLAGGPGRGGGGHAGAVLSKTDKHSNYFPEHAKQQFLDKLKKSGLGDISQGEAKFYYFSSFDTNADEHLDGTELRSALLDYEYDEQTTMQDVEDAVDAILMEDDVNNDGKISWKEYLASESIHEQISPEN